MRHRYEKQHRSTGVILIILALFLLTGCFEASSRATEQAGRIKACQTKHDLPLTTAYHLSHGSYLLPYAKETDGLSEERGREILQRAAESLRDAQTRYFVCVLLLCFLVLAAYHISLSAFSVSLSACDPWHAIISYIHDQVGQKYSSFSRLIRNLNSAETRSFLRAQERAGRRVC